MRKLAIALLLLLVVASFHMASAQEAARPVLIISSTLDKPFEVISGFSHFQTIDRGLISSQDSLRDAYIKGLKVLEESARKRNADALINTSFQVVLIPGSDRIGFIIFYGTLVKVK